MPVELHPGARVAIDDAVLVVGKLGAGREHVGEGIVDPLPELGQLLKCDTVVESKRWALGEKSLHPLPCRIVAAATDCILENAGLPHCHDTAPVCDSERHVVPGACALEEHVVVKENCNVVEENACRTAREKQEGDEGRGRIRSESAGVGTCRER